ncbi:MAG: nitrate- and nitrite sensing domain-containing protein [Magnetococcales bacterium]|nr:nitrate- and nitrite sensing domain-containing protein [Magnetococcales bacterium]
MDRLIEKLTEVPFRTKLILILLFPMVAVFVFIAAGIAEKTHQFNSMKRMEQIVNLAITISGCVHEIQKERGMSAGFLGSHGKNFKGDLFAQRIEVNKQIKIFEQLSNEVILRKIGPETHEYLVSALGDYAHLEVIREQVDHFELTSYEAILFYTRMNADFLRIIRALSDISPTARIAAMTYNYNTFLQGKELSGIERAIVASTLSSKQFEPKMYRRFKEVVSEQEILFRLFRGMANNQDQQLFDEIMADPFVKKVQEMRDVISSKGYDSSLYALLGQLNQSMGLSGIYHSIKNLMIRGSLYGAPDASYHPEAWQDHYRKQFETHYQKIGKVVHTIQSLPATEIDRVEREDVEIIWQNIQAYRKSIDGIIALQKQGKTLREIDQDVRSGIKIDDRPAEEAMGRLVQFSLGGQFGIDLYDWFNAMTIKINQLKRVEDHLETDMIQETEDLKHTARQALTGYVLFCLFVIAVSLGFGLLIVRSLKNKTEKIFHVSREVVSGQLSSRIPVETDQFMDELDLIAQSMNDILDSLEKNIQLKQQSMDALQLSEIRVRSVLETAADAIIALNEHGIVEDINIAGRALFGYDGFKRKDFEIVGKPFVNLVTGSSRKMLQQTLQAVLQDGESRVIGEKGDFNCLRSNGALFPAKCSLAIWTMNHTQYFTLILNDISEHIANRRKIERALDLRSATSEILQQSLQPLTLQELLSRALDIILDVPWLGVAQKGAIFLYRESTAQLEMVVQKSLSPELISLCATVPLGHCLCGRAMASGEVVMSHGLDERHEIRFDGMTPHGHYCVPIQSNRTNFGVLNVYLVQGHVFDDEEVVFLINIAYTLASLISRRKAEQKIIQLSRALEQSPVSIVITSNQGSIEYANKSFTDLTGYSYEDVSARNILELKFADDVYAHQIFDKVMMHGLDWSGELHSRKKNGERFWESISFSPVMDMENQITHYIFVSEDVTDKKLSEEMRNQLLISLDSKVEERTRELNQKVKELERTRHELIENEKMASMGRLVAGIAHEVNTPIGVAYGASTQLMEETHTLVAMLEQEEVDEEAFLNSVKIVDEASSLVVRNLIRASELIHSFKRASIDQASDAVRTYSVSEVIHDVLMSLSNHFKRTTIAIRVECPDELKVVGVPGYLYQILTNLLMNSLTHGFAKGTLPGNITIRCSGRQEWIDFSYEDTGIGMSEAARSQAFEPFFTTARGSGGSGLGLYVCYNLVTTKLQGTIAISSVPGQGVRFDCRWPIRLER